MTQPLDRKAARKLERWAAGVEKRAAKHAEACRREAELQPVVRKLIQGLVSWSDYTFANERQKIGRDIALASRLTMNTVDAFIAAHNTEHLEQKAKHKKRLPRNSTIAAKRAATIARNRTANPMIYKGRLKDEFGLTAREIEALGPPDKIQQHYTYKTPRYLYSLKRVMAYATSIGK